MLKRKLGLVAGVGGAWTLTLQGVDNSSPSTSLVLHGRFDVDVALVNNAYVVADHADTTDPINPLGGRIALNIAPISGNGYWIAESSVNGDGNLFFDVPVTGNATWRLVDNAAAKIVVNAAMSHTGGLEMIRGTFEANADFITTGNLQMHSDGGSAPIIKVADGMLVRFSGAP